MPWDRRGKADAKYRTREHIAYAKSLKDQLKREGYLLCTAKVCTFLTRTITNPNGNQPDGLTAGHDDSGTRYDGPQHRRCNVADGARRGRARQRGETANNRRWAL